MSSRHERYLLFALVGVMALVQIALAQRQCLWADEIFSLAIATGHSLEHSSADARPELGDFVEPANPVPAEEFRRYLKHEPLSELPTRVLRAVFLSDTSPPLYYLLLSGWTLVFGTSDTALRLFSAVCSLGCLPFIVAIARRTGGRGVALPACALFAISPLAIYYSTEARMYSLLWLCLLATTWASLALYQHGRSIRFLVLWIAASAAGFLTHYFFVFPWLAILLCLVVQPGRLRRLHLAAATFITVAVILPWYIYLPQSLARWRITMDWLTWRPWHFNRLAAALQLVTQFFSGHAKYLWPGHQALAMASLVLFGIVFATMAWRLRRQLFAPGVVLLWLPFSAACVGPLVFDLARHTYTVAVPRYAIAALPGAYLLAGLGLSYMRSPAKIVILVLIALAWIPSIFSIWQLRARSGEPFRGLAQALSMTERASDLVLVHSIPSGVLGIARYFSGPAAMTSWVGQLGNRRVPESMQTLGSGRSCISFVKVHEVGEPAPEEDWLRANDVVVREKRMGAGNFVEFCPKNAETF
jgi:hypothetical protein